MNVKKITLSVNNYLDGKHFWSVDKPKAL